MHKFGKLLVPAVAACAVGGVALATPAFAAEPTQLNDAQMDGVSAGLFDTTVGLNLQNNINVSPATAVAVGVFSGEVTANAGTITIQRNWIRSRQ